MRGSNDVACAPHQRHPASAWTRFPPPASSSFGRPTARKRRSQRYLCARFLACLLPCCALVVPMPPCPKSSMVHGACLLLRTDTYANHTCATCRPDHEARWLTDVGTDRRRFRALPPAADGPDRTSRGTGALCGSVDNLRARPLCACFLTSACDPIDPDLAGTSVLVVPKSFFAASATLDFGTAQAATLLAALKWQVVPLVAERSTTRNPHNHFMLHGVVMIPLNRAWRSSCCMTGAPTGKSPDASPSCPALSDCAATAPVLAHIPMSRSGCWIAKRLTLTNSLKVLVHASKGSSTETEVV